MWTLTPVGIGRQNFGTSNPRYCSLSIDIWGTPSIAYVANTVPQLRVATRNSNGVWITDLIANTVLDGPSMASGQASKLIAFDTTTSSGNEVIVARGAAQ